ncbi:hypothetical protein VTL71DRAFT_1422 [Oculimacula yallundae]|uniref:Uncharacterized protein n=1 Tax=Oculimacula yallundae TaxID=86028 RepID=A0ABR4CD22_9HELO
MSDHNSEPWSIVSKDDMNMQLSDDDGYTKVTIASELLKNKQSPSFSQGVNDGSRSNKLKEDTALTKLASQEHTKISSEQRQSNLASPSASHPGLEENDDTRIWTAKELYEVVTWPLPEPAINNGLRSESTTGGTKLTKKALEEHTRITSEQHKRIIAVRSALATQVASSRTIYNESTMGMKSPNPNAAAPIRDGQSECLDHLNQRQFAHHKLQPPQCLSRPRHRAAKAIQESSSNPKSLDGETYLKKMFGDLNLYPNQPDYRALRAAAGSNSRLHAWNFGNRSHRSPNLNVVEPPDVIVVEGSKAPKRYTAHTHNELMTDRILKDFNSLVWEERKPLDSEPPRKKEVEKPEVPKMYFQHPQTGAGTMTGLRCRIPTEVDSSVSGGEFSASNRYNKHPQSGTRVEIPNGGAPPMGGISFNITRSVPPPPIPQGMFERPSTLHENPTHEPYHFHPTPLDLFGSNNAIRVPGPHPYSQSSSRLPVPSPSIDSTAINPLASPSSPDSRLLYGPQADCAATRSPSVSTFTKDLAHSRLNDPDHEYMQKNPTHSESFQHLRINPETTLGLQNSGLDSPEPEHRSTRESSKNPETPFNSTTWGQYLDRATSSVPGGQKTSEKPSQKASQTTWQIRPSLLSNEPMTQGKSIQYDAHTRSMVPINSNDTMIRPDLDLATSPSYSLHDDPLDSGWKHRVQKRFRDENAGFEFKFKEELN